MFEIELNADQLICTIDILQHKGGYHSFEFSDTNAIENILRECRFVLSKEELLKAYNYIKEIPKYGPYWCSQYLAVEDVHSNKVKPFRLVLGKNYNDLFAGKLHKICAEPEFLVSDSDNLNQEIDRRWVSDEILRTNTREIFIYDPYLLENFETSLNTLRFIIFTFFKAENPSIYLACSRGNGMIPNSKLEEFKAKFHSVFGENSEFCLLILRADFHDRFLITNTNRISSGVSFIWGQQNLRRGGLAIILSHFGLNRLDITKSLLKRFVDNIKWLHSPGRVGVSLIEKELAKPFIQSPMYLSVSG